MIVAAASAALLAAKPFAAVAILEKLTAIRQRTGK
jgi:hypothetical protein